MNTLDICHRTILYFSLCSVCVIKNSSHLFSFIKIKFEEVKSTVNIQTITAQSHVKALKLNENGLAIPFATSLIGQEKTRVI